MGVYHLMGLGRSPGTVTGPLSYLAHRYQRWNTEDQTFFLRSGEQQQRQKNMKVGDVQAIVLFTTVEIIRGKTEQGVAFLTFEYMENKWGQTSREKKDSPTMQKTMQTALKQLLTSVWPKISGGRRTGDVFWCEIDRRDIRNVYERVAKIVTALSGTGGQGKEIWINLTGGNNVTNFALELTASLSGGVSRSYYVQAQDRSEETCAFFPSENRYWVDLPVIPLTLGPLREAVISLLQEQSLGLDDLYSRLQNKHWDLMAKFGDREIFMDELLKPMWKQGLIAETSANLYEIGPQWELIAPYQQILADARKAQHTIEYLAEHEDWLTRQKISF